jgi:light-regulated signal transduction histidine kinase (bacteriophytochrome)
MNDIAPLVTPLFTIDPAKFTGPFYTAFCEVNHLSIVIQKLLDIGVLLASSEKDPLVHLRVEREETSGLIVSITTNASTVALQHTADIFVMYYGVLAGKTSLGQGSGLEGYLAKRITDTLHIPLNIFPDVEQNRITFQLRIDKKRVNSQIR